MFLPEEDKYSHSKQGLLSQICLFGGRIAEEMTLGEMGVTTGASNDIERATKIARAMVTKWGLSNEMGPLLYDEEEGDPFVGRSMAQRLKASLARRPVRLTRKFVELLMNAMPVPTKS